MVKFTGNSRGDEKRKEGRNKERIRFSEAKCHRVLLKFVLKRCADEIRAGCSVGIKRMKS